MLKGRYTICKEWKLDHAEKPVWSDPIHKIHSTFITSDKAFFFQPKLLLFFLFLHETICCGYSLEAPQWGTSNEYPQGMFLLRNKKNINVDTPTYLMLWTLSCGYVRMHNTANWLSRSFRAHSPHYKTAKICLYCTDVQGVWIASKPSATPFHLVTPKLNFE